MRTTFVIVTVATLLATGVAVSVPQVPAAHAAPEPYCQAYARTAIAQNAENIRRGCGNQTYEWHSNHYNHLNWCRHVSVAEAESHIAARSAALRRC